MSKKHFRELARRLHGLKPVHHVDAEGNRTMTETAHDARLWADVVNAVASVCAQANYRFDRDRFTYACENGL